MLLHLQSETQRAPTLLRSHMSKPRRLSRVQDWGFHQRCIITGRQRIGVGPIRRPPPFPEIPQSSTFRSNRMHEIRTIAIDDPVAWASVTLSRGRLFLLIRLRAPLRCGHYYITIAISSWQFIKRDNYDHSLHIYSEIF